MVSTSSAIPAPSNENTSTLLRRIIADLPKDKVRFNYVLKKLRRRSFGGILIFLAVLGLIPGISLVAGIIMIAIGLQILLGLRAPVLPKFIRDQDIDVVIFENVGSKAIHIIEKVERFIKPRWFFMTAPPMPTVVGLLVVGLATVIMIPLPFSNVPPAIAILILSIGLLERDGKLMLIGIITSLITIAIGVFISIFALESILMFIERK